MNVRFYSLTDDVKVLCARFDLLILLPVKDWFDLFELVEKVGQSLPAYVVALLKTHIQESHTQNQETQ